MVNWRAGLPRPMIRILKFLGISVFLFTALVIGNFLWILLREMAEMTDGGRIPIMPKYHPYVMNSQLDRHEMVAARCGRTYQPHFLSTYQKAELYNRLFVDHRHKFVYCSVPKAACTEWKQVILKTSGVAQYEDKDIKSIFPHYDHQFRRISDLSTINALRVLKDYYTFTFVRDPLVRLVSAWRDKFQHHSKENRSDYVNFHHKYGRQIIRRFRPEERITPQDLERGFPVTFNEYIDYITSFSNPEEMNEHWVPASVLCRPCHVEYNMLGHFEEQKREGEYLLEYLKIQDFVPKNFFRETSTKSRDEALRLLKTLPFRQRKILAQLYRDDAVLFGYNMTQFLDVPLPKWDGNLRPKR